MIGLLCFVLAVLASPFKSKLRLEAENAVLRHQLVVLRRRVHGRVRLTNHDRWFFIRLYRWFPSILKVLGIVRPETLLRWHRAGFRRYWRWKSRRRGGRPRIETELRTLIRRMSIENPLWGAPRIHGELLKLGFEVALRIVLTTRRPLPAFPYEQTSTASVSMSQRCQKETSTRQLFLPSRRCLFRGSGIPPRRGRFHSSAISRISATSIPCVSNHHSGLLSEWRSRSRR
jgi:hypothetical protein